MVTLTNVSEAVVKSGAKINQDANWHDKDTDPAGADVNDHPNQAQNRADGNPGDGKGEQVVSIEATNYQQTINMTGNFKLPDLSFEIVDNPALSTPTEKRYKAKKEYSLNPAGTGGSSGGAGGSIFITVQNNTTHAIVEDDARSTAVATAASI